MQGVTGCDVECFNRCVMVEWIVPFGKKVKADKDDCLINYRAYEESLRNIERLIKEETPQRRAKLIKIKKAMNKVLNDL